jgi:hypothetical protein
MITNRCIETKFKIQTKTVAVDFSSEQPTYLDGVKAAIQDLDVGILGRTVNTNVTHLV